MAFLRVRRMLLFVLAGGVMAVSLSAQTVSISSPGTSSSSPMHVVASASSSRAISYMQLYLDGVRKYQVNSSTHLDTYQAASAGTHRVTVQAADSTGYIFKQTEYVTVGSTTSSSSGSTTTTTGTLISGIDQMTGWQNCDRCAGANGAGPITPHSMYQGISTPSLDGRSAQFNIAPTVSFGDALWWKQLGAQSAASHFVYDLYFYLKNPSAAQALEFDANQSVSGKKYIFGTQCDRGRGLWEVWDYYSHWVSTGVACGVPSAFTWHHLTWEFERISGKMHFIAFTYDGVKHYINQYHTPAPSSVNELNVAFQMDGNGSGTDYSAWLDKISLRYW